MGKGIKDMIRFLEFLKKWKWIVFVILIYGFAAYLILNGINWG